jgi:4-hydroxythreonine-4-phosphate dehydrogenase
MDPTRPARLALTLGEPAGVGPELVARLAMGEHACELIAVGDPALLAARAAALGLALHLEPFDAARAPATHRAGHLPVLAVPLAVPSTPGVLEVRNAASVVAMLDAAVHAALAGGVDALVTAPVHKGIINDAGIAFRGHTEHFAAQCGGVEPVMMLMAGGLRVALATTHLALREVPDAVTAPRLERVLTVLDAELRARFGFQAPRIAVLGLNPHAGEGGHLGREELDVIIPVLTRLRAAGLQLVGPLPADTAFTPRALNHCDAVLAMYHDQGLPVLKHAGFGHAVNVTLGLPIVRTSVDHGTALDLAGTGQAEVGSLAAALAVAHELARRSHA